MPSQSARSQTTRSLLCAAFRTSLLEHGLEATTTDAVLAATGLSKGAMYHQFRSKNDVIEAVYRAESHGAIERAIAAAQPDGEPIERLKQSCLAWLDELRDPKVTRILFDIGPSALGLKRVIQIENELSLKLIRDLLAEAEESGQVCLARPELAARLINALMGEIATQKSADRAFSAKVIGPLIDGLLDTFSAQQNSTQEA